ncbi:hypothetical protein [Reticulibacter mediterranei]|nr:hypothetical protein [Reticulibacter mediterranei]
MLRIVWWCRCMVGGSRCTEQDHKQAQVGGLKGRGSGKVAGFARSLPDPL